LRSLEEFRKNPHVKIPPKSPSTNFQILGEFKNTILIQKFLFFPDFRPGRPRGLFDLWPGQPTGRAVPRRPKQSRPAHPARALVASPFQITPSRAGRLSLVSLSTGPHLLDSPPSPRRPTLVRNFPAPPLHASDALELLQPSLITPPLNPLQTEH
jgi:hypothetical protein